MDWPKRIRDAALELSGPGAEPEEEEYGTRLLRDIRTAFANAKSDRLPTIDLIRELAYDTDGPWADWWNSDRSEPERGAPQRLARRLRTFGIQSQTIRLSHTTLKGYYEHQFADTWDRYQVSAPSPEPSQPSQDSDSVAGVTNVPEEPTEERRGFPSISAAVRRQINLHHGRHANNTPGRMSRESQDRLLSATDLAVTLGMSRRWVYAQVEEHGLPAYKLGRTLLFEPSAVEHWLSEHRVGEWPKSCAEQVSAAGIFSEMERTRNG